MKRYFYVLLIFGLLITSTVALAKVSETAFVWVLGGTKTTKEVVVWVQGVLGIGIETPGLQANTIYLNKGEWGGTWIKIINKGNIRDKIRLEAKLQPPSAEGWLKYEFRCTGTAGECKGNIVDNIEMRPDIRSTEVYLRTIAYRSDLGNPQIQMVGYSLTNYTYQNMTTLDIHINSPNILFNPAEAPGLMDFMLPILFLTALLIYPSLKDQ
ncbi:MAG: hypothetical protein DRP11_02055 [Candidatus Aenigmatarchaeota archaeon]|nr:MAG: hypothetical protein DRP11_02055 [Candidatus Aenigmarchaeota archaeon]